MKTIQNFIEVLKVSDVDKNKRWLFQEPFACFTSKTIGVRNLSNIRTSSWDSLSSTLENTDRADKMWT